MPTHFRNDLTQSEMGTQSPYARHVRHTFPVKKSLKIPQRLNASYKETINSAKLLPASHYLQRRSVVEYIRNFGRNVDGMKPLGAADTQVTTLKMYSGGMRLTCYLDLGYVYGGQTAGRCYFSNGTRLNARGE
jgi:hypothetical protein